MLNVFSTSDESSVCACINCTCVTCAGGPGGQCTVLEISGHDRPGLLSETMEAFAQSDCSVWSASIWTNKDRATFVLGVRDARRPLTDDSNWAELHATLVELLGGEAGGVTVTMDTVVRRHCCCGFACVRMGADAGACEGREASQLAVPPTAAMYSTFGVLAQYQ